MAQQSQFATGEGIPRDWKKEAGQLLKKVGFQTMDAVTLLRRLNWLEEGPDNYDTLLETVASSELRKVYSPFLIWGVSLFNANAAGGANILIKFVDVSGNFKQYKLPGNASLSLSPKGGMGSVMRYQSDGTGNVDFRGFVLLKLPFQG